jgi:hypothetical protein
LATRTQQSAAPAAKKAAAKKAAAKKAAAKKTTAKAVAAKPAAAAPAAVKKAAAKKAAAKSAAAKPVAARKAAATKAAKPAPKPAAKPAAKKAAKKAGTRAAAPRPDGRALPAAAAAAPASLPDEFFSAYTGELLTEDDYVQAAQALGCEVAAIKAVAEVETRESPFDARNRPTILYERHKFAAATVPPGKFNDSHPDLSARSGYGPGGYGTKEQQYVKLARAYALDPDAALKAASWGKFQILGSNHKACGHATVAEFVKAMTVSEREHLRAFAHFVAANPAMRQALRNLDWAGFAKRYNGPEYAQYKYDQKMAAAHRKFAG